MNQYSYTLISPETRSNHTQSKKIEVDTDPLKELSDECIKNMTVIADNENPPLQSDSFKVTTSNIILNNSCDRIIFIQKKD